MPAAKSIQVSQEARRFRQDKGSLKAPENFEPNPSLSFQPSDIDRPSGMIVSDCAKKRIAELSSIMASKKITEQSVIESYQNGHAKGYDRGIIEGIEMSMRACSMMRPMVSSNTFTYLEGLLAEVRSEQIQST